MPSFCTLDGTRFEGVLAREYLSKKKDGGFINLDNKEITETHWTSLFFDKNIPAYFDYFIIEYIWQEVLKKDKSLTTYLEYNMMVTLYVDFIVLYLHNICPQERL